MRCSVCCPFLLKKTKRPRHGRSQNSASFKEGVWSKLPQFQVVLCLGWVRNNVKDSARPPEYLHPLPWGAEAPFTNGLQPMDKAVLGDRRVLTHILHLNVEGIWNVVLCLSCVCLRQLATGRNSTVNWSSEYYMAYTISSLLSCSFQQNTNKNCKELKTVWKHTLGGKIKSLKQYDWQRWV